MNREEILREADRCVKCGICLPHCPTYLLKKNEGDSPRGRIALMQALFEERLSPMQLQQHLDLCLGCRACETACPSGVSYGKLLDATRAHVKTTATTDRTEQLQRTLITKSSYKPWSRHLLNLYLKPTSRSLGRALGGKAWQRLDGLLPNNLSTRSTDTFYPALGKREARIALFTGCVSRLTESSALHSAIAVLTRSGIEVVVPEAQGCCGAIHQHGGDPDGAARMAQANIAAFNNQGADALLYLASGCGAQLETYTTQDLPLKTPVTELSQFLVTNGCTGGELRPLKKNLALHTPCSLRNAIHGEQAPRQLLNQIPELTVEPMTESGNCCGAAGQYLISQKEMSDGLRESSLDELDRERPHYLATSNSGCALHLGAGIRLRGLPIEVVHPIQLIDQQSREP